MEFVLTGGGQLSAASDQCGIPFWVCRKCQAVSLGDRQHGQSAISPMFMKHTTAYVVVIDLLPAWKMNR